MTLRRRLLLVRQLRFGGVRRIGLGVATIPLVLLGVTVSYECIQRNRWAAREGERERERELCDTGDTLCPPLERVEYGSVLVQVRYGRVWYV